MLNNQHGNLDANNTLIIETIQPNNSNRSWINEKRYWIAGGLVTILFIVYGQKSFMDILGLFLGWVESIGVWGNVMFVLMFFLVSFPFVWGGYIPLTMGAGSLYGVIMGTITVSIGSTLGGVLSFWLCKYAIQNWFDATKVKNTPQFKFFVLMLTDEQSNAVLVTLLARWAPIPFGVQNIFFVLAEVPFINFFFVTWLGLLPLQILYAYFGATLRNVSKIATGEVELDFIQKLSFLFQIAVVIALILYFVFLSRRIRLRQQRQRRLIELQVLNNSSSNSNSNSDIINNDNSNRNNNSSDNNNISIDLIVSN